jgi:hypothetical protein
MKRASRAVTHSALLGAAQAPERQWQPADGFAAPHADRATKSSGLRSWHTTSGGTTWQVVSCFTSPCGGEERRFGAGARSAHRPSDSPRLFERSAGTARSELRGARPQTEYHSEVGAQRRPPHRDAEQGTACHVERNRKEFLENGK